MPNQRIVNSAKIIQAQALKEKGSSVYLAIGSGSSSWDTEIQINKTFVSDQFTLLPTNAYADQVKLYLLNRALKKIDQKLRVRVTKAASSPRAVDFRTTLQCKAGKKM